MPVERFRFGFTLPRASAMAAWMWVFLSYFLWIASATERKELTITCQSPDDCILPCQFQSDGKGARIMWYKKKAVVSCTRYGNTSFVVGHNSPADKYKGRTELFAQHVLDGNATLVLKNVTPIDEGKYFCITMTAPSTDESGVISLVVEAPVRDVDIDFSGDAVTCSAEGIYPAPTLSWSTDPPTDIQLLQSKTTTNQSKLGFYSVHSSLKLTRNISTGHTYICSVSCDVNRRTAFLKGEVTAAAPEGGSVKILCSSPSSTSQRFNLTWKFGCCDPIASISGAHEDLTIWSKWRHHVFSNFSLLSGLQLHSLSSDHQGSYICEVSTSEETYVTWTDVVITQESNQYVLMILIILGLIYLLCLSYGVIAILGCKLRKLKRAQQQVDSREGTTVSLTGQQDITDPTANDQVDNAEEEEEEEEEEEPSAS